MINDAKINTYLRILVYSSPFNGASSEIRCDKRCSVPHAVGETDASSDNIPGSPAIGTPCCFMLGSQTKLVVNDPKVVSWDVISLSLDGQPTKRHYWSVGDTGMMPASQTVTLPAMPSNVDYAWLYYDIVLSYPLPGGGTNTVVEQMGGGYHQDMFFTFAAPQGPLVGTGWDNVLKVSCTNASQSTTIADAEPAETFGVFWDHPGFYYPGNTAVYCFNSNGQYMLGWVSDNLLNRVPFRGNCLDCSTANALLTDSLGINTLTRQLTIDSGFTTNPICPVGSDATLWPSTYSSFAWGWHSIAVPYGSAFGGGTSIFDPTEAQHLNLDGNSYENPPADGLGSFWSQGGYWQTNPSRGLVSSPNPSYPLPYTGLPYPIFQSYGDDWISFVTANKP